MGRSPGRERRWAGLCDFARWLLVVIIIIIIILNKTNKQKRTSQDERGLCRRPGGADFPGTQVTTSSQRIHSLENRSQSSSLTPIPSTRTAPGPAVFNSIVLNGLKLSRAWSLPCHPGSSQELLHNLHPGAEKRDTCPTKSN